MQKECYTPDRLGKECAFFDCSKGTECALCAQSVECIRNMLCPPLYLLTVKHLFESSCGQRDALVCLQTMGVDLNLDRLFVIQWSSSQFDTAPPPPHRLPWDGSVTLWWCLHSAMFQVSLPVLHTNLPKSRTYRHASLNPRGSYLTGT